MDFLNFRWSPLKEFFQWLILSYWIPFMVFILPLFIVIFSTKFTIGGLDFTWKSNDNSSVFAHFMSDHYNEGYAMDQPRYENGCVILSILIVSWNSNCDNLHNLNQRQTCEGGSYTNGFDGNVNVLLDANRPISPTNYIFIPGNILYLKKIIFLWN
jgi:hypothetical protein